MISRITKGKREEIYTGIRISGSPFKPKNSVFWFSFVIRFCLITVDIVSVSEFLICNHSLFPQRFKCFQIQESRETTPK